MSLSSVSQRAKFARKLFAATILTGVATDSAAVTIAELNGGNAVSFLIFSDDPPAGITAGTLVLQGHLRTAGAGVFTNVKARDGTDVDAPDTDIFMEDGPLMDGGVIFATIPAQYLESEFYDSWRVRFTPTGATMTNVIILSAISNPTITPHNTVDDALLANFHKGATISLG